MKLGFYIDRETRHPHIYQHGVDELEVRIYCAGRVRIGRDAKVRVWQSVRPVAGGTCE